MAKLTTNSAFNENQEDGSFRVKITLGKSDELTNIYNAHSIAGAWSQFCAEFSIDDNEVNRASAKTVIL